jgi:hypothetical protein
MIRKIVLGVVAVVVVRMGLTPLELGYSPFALVKAILAAN